MKSKYIILERGSLNNHQTGVQIFEKGIIQGLNINSNSSIRVIKAPKQLKSALGRLFYEQIIIPLYLNLIGRPYSISLLNSFPILYSKNIITIHDLAPLQGGNWYKSKKYYLYYKIILPKLIGLSKKIITVSNFSKNEIIKYYNVSSEKIIVLGNSVSFTKREEIKSNELYPCKIFNGKYILTVGSLDPRKNLDKVIQSFKIANLQDYSLVIVGAQNKIFNYKSKSSLKNIVFTGYIEKFELINYYKYCDLFINLSCYEGFGIPILEALHFNKPVIASDIEVYKELFHRHIILADIDNIKSIGLKIHETLISKKKQGQLNDVNLKRFSWPIIAKKLIESL